jgi:hypothetical protein
MHPAFEHGTVVSQRSGVATPHLLPMLHGDCFSMDKGIHSRVLYHDRIGPLFTGTPS